MDKTPATNRRNLPQSDPALAALRRLLNATDRNLRTAEEVRRARIELAKVVEHSHRG
jgi:hypothetical protein